MFEPQIKKFKSSENDRAGVIERIKLTHFMNHEMLEFGPLVPSVNFIVGPNGTGKSALVTALVIGLGGRCDSTDRGKSIANLIMYHQKYAEILITLQNVGCDAYQPEMYDKCVSTKVRDLQSILDSFNIQITNPCTVLNQTQSKEFLHSKSPADKYRFFLKATRIEEMEGYLSVIDVNCKKLTKSLSQKETDLQELFRVANIWHKRYDQIKGIQKAQNKVVSLRNEIVWCQVIKLEREAEEAEVKMTTEKKRSPQYVVKVTECQAKLKELNSSLLDQEKAVKSIASNIRNYEKEYEKKHHDLTIFRREERKIEGEKQEIEEQLRKYQNEIDSYSKRIQEIIQENTSRDVETEKQEREQKLKSLSEKIDSIESSLKVQNDDIRRISDTNEQDVEQANVLRGSIRAKQNEIIRMTDYLKTLQQGSGATDQRFKRYGRLICTLVERIAVASRNKKFSMEPVGPLGAYIKLKDQRYALPAESAIRSHLTHFVVNSHSDKVQLNRLINEVYRNDRQARKPGVAVMNFQGTVYDVSRFKADIAHDESLRTVFDVLSFDSAVVANCLIDLRHIENVLVFDDIKKARSLMAENPPRRVTEAFAYLDESNVELLKPSPSFRSYPRPMYGARYLTKNMTEQIQQVQRSLKKLSDDLGKLQEEHEELNIKTRKHTAELSRITRAINSMKHKQRMLIKEKANLERINEPTLANIAPFEEEKLRIENEVRNINENVLSEVTGRLTSASETVKDTITHLQTLDKKVNEVRDTVNPMQNNLLKTQREVEDTNVNLAYWKKKKDEHDGIVKELRTDFERKKNDAEENERVALQRCNRVNTRRNFETIRTELTMTEKAIKEQRERQGDPVEIQKMFKEKTLRYKIARKAIRQQKETLDTMSKGTEDRKRRFIFIRRKISEGIRKCFSNSLACRKFTGSLDFDHEKRRLELQVDTQSNLPDDSNRTAHKISRLSNRKSSTSVSTVKNMKILSGGERSFALVCFINSLWRSANTPFRCLDEFDVFMDLVNRRKSLELLLRFAFWHSSSSDYSQYLFLTPQDLSPFKDELITCKIWKMPDVRNRRPNALRLDRIQTDDDEVDIDDLID